MPLSKDKYNERRKNGLCIQCGAPSKKARCDRCAASSKANRGTRRENRKATGICTECPNQAKPDCSMCETCSALRSDISTQRYYENKAEGVCRLCGAESGGKSRCAKHVKMMTNWRNRQKEGQDSNGGK